MAFTISIISLCLCVSSFFFFRWYIQRKTAARELLADYRSEVYRLIAEIDAAADRDSLLVEERIKILRKLLDDTDRRISVYMRELQRSRNGEAMYASLGRGIRAALDSRPLPPDVEQPEKVSEEVSQTVRTPPVPSAPIQPELIPTTAAVPPKPATAPGQGRKRASKKNQSQGTDCGNVRAGSVSRENSFPSAHKPCRSRFGAEFTAPRGYAAG